MTKEDELTLKGFLDFHTAIASKDNGDQQLWNILKVMGYNHQLQIEQVIINYQLPCFFIMSMFI